MEIARNNVIETAPGALSVPRRAVATFSSYADAQRAVDFLADRMFPVERAAIVADGLRLIEQVTGRLTYGRVAANGALSGGLMGAFFGFIFGLFSLVTPLVSAFRLMIYGALYGALVGAALTALFHAFWGGKRDFSSVGAMAADRYQVMVDIDVAEEAQRLLSVMLEGRQPRAASEKAPLSVHS